MTKNGKEWGGGRKDGDMNDPETIKEKGGAEGLDYNVMLSNKSLCAEWSMSEVGISPPNNLDKSYTLVTRI